MKYIEIYQDTILKENYDDSFFEEFSFREWVAWDRESGFELVYEESDEVKKGILNQEILFICKIL